MSYVEWEQMPMSHKHSSLHRGFPVRISLMYLPPFEVCRPWPGDNFGEHPSRLVPQTSVRLPQMRLLTGRSTWPTACIFLAKSCGWLVMSGHDLSVQDSIKVLSCKNPLQQRKRKIETGKKEKIIPWYIEAPCHIASCQGTKSTHRGLPW